MTPEEIEDTRARARAYHEELDAKLERKEELTPREKRFLLRTGHLPYKALTFPESLTPAERNRIRYMPPPDVVTANILKVTNGAMSTTEEVFQKAIDSAETMSDGEIELIVRGFTAPESLYEKSLLLPWMRKLGRPGELAFAAVTTKVELTAHQRAVMADTPERHAQRSEREWAKIGPIETSEQHNTYFQNEKRLRALAVEKGRVMDEQDEKLFAESRQSMKKMADELNWAECHCESCDGKRNKLADPQSESNGTGSRDGLEDDER